jgi:hypothetical protein
MKGKTKIPLLSHQQILDALDYNPATGVFKWKISPAKNVKAGTIAGGNSKSNEYRYIRLNNYEVTEGRLAWFYMTGEWPEGRVKYKNGDKQDCRFENLTTFRKIAGEWDHSSAEGRNKYLREYRRADPILEKERYLLRRFEISMDDYNRMLEAQGGVCAICKHPETHKRNGKLKAMAVDHSHKTGAIRGLLCCDCNTGIGKLKDSVNVLSNAIEYLRKHNINDTN